LRSGGFVEPLLEHIDAGKPMLGICVGMQMLFDVSEEFGQHQGLGLIPGKVVRFPAGMVENNERLKVPHMGWNNITIKQQSPLFKEIADESFVYFVHSYYCAAENSADVAATCRYGDIEFSASLWRDNIMATQFHPEKSQTVGLNIFKNFGEL
jgi:glutamine amidotransferase